MGIRTAVEKYGGTRLSYCTYHYWLMRGKTGGVYTLDEYARSSAEHGFVISLPSTSMESPKGEDATRGRALRRRPQALLPSGDSENQDTKAAASVPFG